MQIIVRGQGSEPERRKREAAQAILKHYYRREQVQGSRIKLPASKATIRKVYS